MTKIILNDVSNLQTLTSSAATINDNNNILETASDNTLSRDGTSPNSMLSNLDMNSNQILNLPSPATMNSPARLQDVVSNPTVLVPNVGTSGASVGLLNTGWTQSGNNTWTGTNNFTNTVTFSSITLPANSVSSSNIVNASVTGADLANNTVANANLSQMAANTIKGNNTAGLANAADLTTAQVAAMLGVYSNNSVTKTSNYTVTTSDSGTIVLGGGVQFTLTVPNPATFAANFCLIIVNSDTRGKIIAASGISNFILWPGKTILLFNVNGVWVVTDQGRWAKQSAVFYVDNVNGSDNNDGLASGTGAFASIGKACDSVYRFIDCQNSAPVINVANGIYGESVTLSGQLTGYNVMFIIGASPSGVEWRPLSGFCLLVSDNAEVEVQNIKFNNFGGPANNFGIAVHQTGVVDVLSGCEFGTFGTGPHLSLDHGGGSINLPASYTVSGSCGSHILVGGASSVTSTGGGTVTISGAPAITTWIQATGSGANISLAPGTTFSGAPAAGTQKYAISLNASLSLSGNTLPGTVAGAVASGGQAV